MSLRTRIIKDKLFTMSAGGSILLLIATLVIILIPMLWRGSKAVVFDGTVEFRRLQFDLYERGNAANVKAQVQAFDESKAKIYELLNKFSEGIDTDESVGRAKDIYREYGKELRYNNAENYADMRDKAKEIRDTLIDALETPDKQVAIDKLNEVLKGNDAAFEGSVFAKTFDIARNYLDIVKDTDLGRRETYKDELVEVKELVLQLFGPEPGAEKPALIMQRYGATRLDYAQKLINDIVYKQTWEKQAGSESLVMTQTKRSEVFAGTIMQPFFETLPQKATEMLDPKFTVYWQYFIDDSTPGHFFGGVGPEILGTLTLTLLAMLFAVPLGIISAAYLAECASDNMAIKIIRMSINTLAGVPSIVFGLFGMAFFVLFLMPALGLESKPCILTASMTLAILVLPVIIRASEEAIKAVPRTYREASLALGAGGFKTFVSVTLPAAMPGILTGIILSLSRAAGETAPILFTGAVAFGPIPKSLTESTRALSYGCYDMAVGDRIAMMVPHQQYGMVATLIVLVLCLNLVAICVRSKMSSKLRGN